MRFADHKQDLRKMQYCLICWGDKEPAKSCPRKYCLKCAKDIRRQKDRIRQNLLYESKKDQIKARAINYYYKNREKVLKYKNDWYQNKVMESIKLIN